MANTGAKKRKEENEKHLRVLRYVILGCNAVYIIVRMLIFHSSFTWKHWMGLLLTSGVEYVVYSQLAAMAKPEYSDNGELLDGGADLNMGGLTGYLHDVVYITCFVQVMSMVSDYLWLVYLVIPSFALYKIWGSFVYPLFIQGGGASSEDEEDKARKKREKMERRSQRPKFARR
eukprot:TRINITY_DN26889_c0_g1_i1.p1 TRINITY_DN26889_c0_g1~~TRINITY_DN26889_c0_g1_i1.p1  ORF type:complete len:174 (-),score=20.61 TRINITY_DN26889_c0_g1_i1:97-618(-)